MRVAVQTAGGNRCELSPGDEWTFHDLGVAIHRELGVPVPQQRLIHGRRVLQEFMDTAAINTMGQLLRMSAGPETPLELLLIIRSPAVVKTLEAVKSSGMALQLASEEHRCDREVVMEAVKQNYIVVVVEVVAA
eukprot:16429784-Heterocapsa_arctica.AAC.1